MATIQRFEDLAVWTSARELARAVYAATKVGDFARDFELRNQIRRSAGSVMDNIAEGFDRGGRGEFMQFLGIAKGSAGEVKSQLHRAHDQAYLTEPEFEHLYNQAEEVSRQIKGFLNYLHTSNIKGSRYKSPEPSSDN